MKKSVVIPVWNGAQVIEACLDALIQDGEDAQIICVDNGSQDGSAAVIQEKFPGIELLSQPANLGFAGGVNLGIQHASGEMVVLLNQDCLVSPGWLSALERALEENPRWGIVGALLLDADGSIEHAGAFIRRPDALGIHHHTPLDQNPYEVEYVTGAVFGLRRSLWQEMAGFDEGFFPAYYEESDFCYRARHHGSAIGMAPDCRVRHFHSSRAWQIDPIRHTANELVGRYRFIGKHFDSQELAQFFSAERETIASNQYFDQIIGRVLAARQTLRTLNEIVERRRSDLETGYEPERGPLLHAGFVTILSAGLARANELSLADIEDQNFMQELDLALFPAPIKFPTADGDGPFDRLATKLAELRQREYDLLSQLQRRAFPHDLEEPSPGQRLLRALILRPFDRLSGRHARLRSRLDGVRAARLDIQEDMLNHLHSALVGMPSRSSIEEYRDALHERDRKVYEWLQSQANGQALLRAESARLQRRITLLNQLISYDYR